MEVFAIAALTLDGFIGRFAAERSFDWTTPEDKAAYIAKIKESKHLVMGSTTLQNVRRFPVGTTVYVYTRNPASFNTTELSQAATYQPTNESPQQLVQRLQTAGVEQLAICGGASIYQQFMAAGVITKLYLTIEPTLFGKGIRFFGEFDQEYDLQLIEQKQLNQHGSIWLEYNVLPKLIVKNTSDPVLEAKLYAS